RELDVVEDPPQRERAIVEEAVGLVDRLPLQVHLEKAPSAEEPSGRVEPADGRIQAHDVVRGTAIRPGELGERAEPGAREGEPERELKALVLAPRSTELKPRDRAERDASGHSTVVPVLLAFHGIPGEEENARIGERPEAQVQGALAPARGDPPRGPEGEPGSRAENASQGEKVFSIEQGAPRTGEA